MFYDIHPCKMYQQSKASFNPKRKEKINAEAMAKSYMQSTKEKLRKYPHPPLIDPYSCNLVKEWQAHSDGITKLSEIPDPFGIISCSLDHHVKLWSGSGDLWGDIDLIRESKDKHWQFPFDWGKVRQKEVE